MAIRAVGKLQVAVIAFGCMSKNKLLRVSVKNNDRVVMAACQEAMLGLF